MLIKKPADILASEITPKTVYLARRQFIRAAAAAAAFSSVTAAETRLYFSNL